MNKKPIQTRKVLLILFSVLIVFFAINYIRVDGDKFWMCRVIKIGTSEQLTDFLLTDIGVRKKITEWSTNDAQKNAALERFSRPKNRDKVKAEIALFDKLSKQKETYLYWPDHRGFPAKVPYIIQYKNSVIQSISTSPGSVLATNLDCNR